MKIEKVYPAGWKMETGEETIYFGEYGSFGCYCNDGVIYKDKEATGANCEELGVSAPKPVIIKCIDRSNIKFTPIKESYNEYKTYFEKLNEFDPSTLGGKVPDDEIFMEK